MENGSTEYLWKQIYYSRYEEYKCTDVHQRI